MKLSHLLLERKTLKHSALYMPYFTLGDPDFESSLLIAKGMIDAGADILELGIPFSDPTADGPVIQKAMVRAMKHSDFSLEKIFETTQKIHSINPEIPLVYLTYFNPVYKYKNQKNRFVGESFLLKCIEIGVKGLVIPDLPFDSYEFLEIYDNIKKHHLDISIIPMIAPNTDIKRMKYILSYGSGFVYYITSLGVTGLRDRLPENIKERAKLIRNYTNIPIFAGFGINKPEQAEELKSIFDGIIVGSLNHKIIEEFLNNENYREQIKEKIYKTTKNFVDHLVLI
ncbi:MAG: tryptophan synthase alpha chain [Leptospiraceae bacterium]|nr:MAG: tryptophan synthase alpha chain [Leptospiraceae bacterium]